MEDKAKKQHRMEELQLINSLQDKLADKDQIIKHLLVGLPKYTIIFSF